MKKEPKIVQVAAIIVPSGRRPIDEEHVAALMRMRAGEDKPISVHGHLLLDGAHRLEAAKRRGCTTIHAVNWDADAVEERLAEIGAITSKPIDTADRLRLYAEARTLYIARHPETSCHVAGGKATSTGQRTPSFSSTIADKAGKKTGTIERSIAIGDRLTQEAAEVVRGTPVANNLRALNRIARMSVGQQVNQAKAEVKMAVKVNQTNVAEKPAVAELEAEPRKAQLRLATPEGEFCDEPHVVPSTTAAEEPKPKGKPRGIRKRSQESILKDEEIGRILKEGRSIPEAAEVAGVSIERVNRAKQNLGMCRPNTILDRAILQVNKGSISIETVLDLLEKNHVDGTAGQWSQLKEALQGARTFAEKAIRMLNRRQ